MRFGNFALRQKLLFTEAVVVCYYIMYDIIQRLLR